MQSIISFLETQQDNFLADLTTLVNRDCGTHNKSGVDTVGNIMRQHLEDVGCAVETIPLETYGNCVVGRIKGRGRLRIMLIGHLDTVYPDGTVAQRPMRIEHGHIVGPGACDMKSGLLTGVYALKALRTISFDDFDELIFFCNSEEEVGSPASQEHYRALAQQVDVVLVLESARANGAIVTARKGGGVYKLSVTGRAAHAGVEPEKGASAILALTHYIHALHELNNFRPGVTINIGVVRGGTAHNVIPDQAEAIIDFRVARREDIPPLNTSIHEAITTTHIRGTSAQLEGGIEVFPMEKTPAVAFLADQVRQVAAKINLNILDIETGGTSDANVIAELGIPVLDGLGPVGGRDHSPDEYIVLDSIMPRTAVLAGLIMQIARERETLRIFGRQA